MKPITDKQRQALAILQEKGPLIPASFSIYMWGGGRGRTLAAGSILSRLEKKGFVKPDPEWVDRYMITELGKQAL